MKLIQRDRGTRPEDVRQPPRWEGANSCRMIAILKDKSEYILYFDAPFRWKGYFDWEENREGRPA